MANQTELNNIILLQERKQKGMWGGEGKNIKASIMLVHITRSDLCLVCDVFLSHHPVLLRSHWNSVCNLGHWILRKLRAKGRETIVGSQERSRVYEIWAMTIQHLKNAFFPPLHCKEETSEGGTTVFFKYVKGSSREEGNVLCSTSVTKRSKSGIGAEQCSIHFLKVNH